MMEPRPKSPVKTAKGFGKTLFHKNNRNNNKSI